MGEELEAWLEGPDTGQYTQQPERRRLLVVKAVKPQIDATNFSSSRLASGQILINPYPCSYNANNALAPLSNS
jgi:hypothetical protein